MCKCSFVEYVCSCNEPLCAHLIPSYRCAHGPEMVWQTDHDKWAYCPSFLWSTSLGDSTTSPNRFPTSRPISPVSTYDIGGNQSYDYNSRYQRHTVIGSDLGSNTGSDGSSCSRASSPGSNNQSQRQGQDRVFENPRCAPHAPQQQRTSRLRALFSSSATGPRMESYGAPYSSSNSSRRASRSRSRWSSVRAHMQSWSPSPARTEAGGRCGSSTPRNTMRDVYRESTGHGPGGYYGESSTTGGSRVGSQYEVSSSTVDEERGGDGDGRGSDRVQLAIRPSEDDRHGGRIPVCENIMYEGWRVRRPCQWCIEFMTGRRDCI